MCYIDNNKRYVIDFEFDSVLDLTFVCYFVNEIKREEKWTFQLVQRVVKCFTVRCL